MIVFGHFHPNWTGSLYNKEVEDMGLVWVGDRGTCPPHDFRGGGQKVLCPPHVSQGKIFLFSAQMEIKNKELPDCP